MLSKFVVSCIIGCKYSEVTLDPTPGNVTSLFFVGIWAFQKSQLKK